MESTALRSVPVAARVMQGLAGAMPLPPVLALLTALRYQGLRQPRSVPSL